MSLTLIFFNFTFGNHQRRLGKLDTQTWDRHYLLGSNASPYEDGKDIPSFSAVGALISNDGILGTATLISSDVVITAAHVLKNRTKDPIPDKNDWEFILYHDFDKAPQGFRYSINRFFIHPNWIIRQEQHPPFGDGDRTGYDIALAKLDQKIVGVKPLSLPNDSYLRINQKVFVAGFGNLVEGGSGFQNFQNSRRMAGENRVDRIVENALSDGLQESLSGGLLAFDFDSPYNAHNSLGQGASSFENLPEGNSDHEPLEFEVSTAEGDSGAPLISYEDGIWQIFGTVSYGSSDSTYGDITVCTRLKNHIPWISENISAWPGTMIVNDSGWRESQWLGHFFNFNSGWNFHETLGWFWSLPKNENSVWAFFDHSGWLWTSRDNFPFFYSEKQQNWFFIDLSITDLTGWFLYEFSVEQWKHLKF